MIYPEENGKESLHCEFHYNKMNMLNRKMFLAQQLFLLLILNTMNR